MRAIAAAVCVLAIGAPAHATVYYGNVEWRWRDRALGVLPVVGGKQTTSLAPGAVASTPDAVINATNTTDARFHLILEARVTRAVGNTDLIGLGAFAGAAISTDLRNQGAFAGMPLSGGQITATNAAAANTIVATAPGPGGPAVTLPAGATLLPGGTAFDRAVFGPFRGFTSTEFGTLGVPNYSSLTQGEAALANRATMERFVVLGTTPPFFDGPSIDPDTGEVIPVSPYYQHYEFMGLDNWVPVLAMTYNILDVVTPRDIAISFALSNSSSTDSNVRGLRAIEPGTLYPITTGAVPDFVISVVPAPGAGAILGLGGLAAVRRRR